MPFKAFDQVVRLALVKKAIRWIVEDVNKKRHSSGENRKSPGERRRGFFVGGPVQTHPRSGGSAFRHSVYHTESSETGRGLKCVSVKRSERNQVKVSAS